MDPITAAATRLREDFQRFARDPRARVLRILAEAEHAEALGKILRIEEWQPDNRRPFLIFHNAWTREDETCEALCRGIAEHYRLLRQGLAEESRELPEFGLALPEQADLTAVKAHLLRFIEATHEVLDPPYVCWLPTDVRDEAGFLRAVMELLSLDGPRLVLRDEPQAGRLDEPLRFLDEALIDTRYTVDDDGLRQYFKALLGAPARGRMPGTLPGSAAPDVEPPPRPDPQPASAEAIRTTAAELKLPPMLSPDDGLRLHRLIFVAANAAGDGDEAKALKAQRAACKLCRQAGVKLEQALMTLLLATYLIQFDRRREAEQCYREADILAGEAAAYPQIAQARLALGFLLLQDGRPEEAADAYEQAAAAAVIGQVNLLYLEALRLVGTCHLQTGHQRHAFLCWRAAVRRAEQLSPGEIRSSSFVQIAGELIGLLDGHGYGEQARAVERLVTAAGTRAAA